jgi:hypothetical protein
MAWKPLAAAFLVVALVVMAMPGPDAAASLTASVLTSSDVHRAAPSTSGGVRLDWGDDIEDLLDDLIDILSGAKDKVDAATQAVQIEGLEEDLDVAVALIDQLFDPAVAPNLQPVNAGWIDPAVEASDLPGYAEVCLKMAKAAGAEGSLGTSADHTYIGTRLKTIRNLIERESPHSYRSLAAASP